MYSNLDLTVSKTDRDVLHRLATRVADMASKPEQDEKRLLWYRHNALEATRPLVFCDPEMGWHDIITDDQLECVGELARQWEWRLRTEVFWGEEMGDDRPVEAVFDVEYAFTETDWGLSDTVIGGENRGAYIWKSPLATYDDLDKLRVPRIDIDWNTTKSALELASEVMGDILDVRLNMRWFLGVGLTQTASRLRGLEQIMMDMYDEPEGFHRLMSFLRDGTMQRLDYLERNNLLSLNNDCTYVSSGGFGYSHELPQSDYDGQHVRLRDTWGYAESQETCSVSPGMFEEFVFAYQKPILERFGLTCYGCCEALERRMSILKGLQNLRRVSVSPWADREVMAEALGNGYIYSLKPHPADLTVIDMDVDRIRKELRNTLNITRECRVEIIMKDLMTLRDNPSNVVTWCRIAREEIENM